MQFFRLGFFWCVLLIIILGIAIQGNARNYQVHSICMNSIMKDTQWPLVQSDDFTLAESGADRAIIPQFQYLAASTGAGNIPIRRVKRENAK